MTNPFDEAKSDHESESAPDVETELAALRQRAELAELEAMRQRAELAEQKLALLEQQGETKKRGRISRAFRFSAKVWVGWLFFHVMFTLLMVLLLVGAAFVFGAGSAVDKFDQVNIEIGGDDPASTTSTTSVSTTSTPEPCPEGTSPLICLLNGGDPKAPRRGETFKAEEWLKLQDEMAARRIQQAREAGECHLLSDVVSRIICQDGDE